MGRIYPKGQISSTQDGILTGAVLVAVELFRLMMNAA
jgi:hypothetical protein